MDERVIIFKNENGGVSICYPSNGTPIERIKLQDTPAHSLIVKKSRLPFQDYDFFNCWQILDGVNVTINLEKAKEVTKQRIRVERKSFLNQLDIEFQRALETGTDTTSVINKKNKLRNLTDLVNHCSSLEELRNIKVEI